MDLQSNINGFLDLLKKGQMMDAFEKYYADEVVMQENTEPPRVGKAKNREYQQEFMSTVEAVHDSQVKHVAVNPSENVAMIQSYMDVTLKGQGRVKMEEVAIQTWKGDKIVQEQFFYKM